MLEELKPYINEKNSKFISKLIPNGKPCLGLYTKDLKQIAKQKVEQKAFSFFKEKHLYYEEDMIHIFMITYIKDFDYMMECLKNTLPLLNNWAMVDQLVCNLKIVKKHKPEVLKLLEQYRYSKREYEVRFVLIMLLSYYCELEYQNLIFEIINDCYKDAYYIKMAIAWLLCDCMIKLKDKTLEYIKTSNLDAWTINKAIQKMLESYRITNEDKDYLRTLKRKV